MHRILTCYRNEERFVHDLGKEDIFVVDYSSSEEVVEAFQIGNYLVMIWQKHWGVFETKDGKWEKIPHLFESCSAYHGHVILRNRFLFLRLDRNFLAIDLGEIVDLPFVLTTGIADTKARIYGCIESVLLIEDEEKCTLFECSETPPFGYHVENVRSFEQKNVLGLFCGNILAVKESNYEVLLKNVFSGKCCLF